MLRSEERYLIDFNYTIEKVISSSTFGKMNEWIMMLELYLKDNKSGEIEKVMVEMKRDELAAFVTQLSKFHEELAAHL